MATDIEKAPEALQELVAKADTGARKPLGATAKLIFGVALAWALFQFWYASPLPFMLRFGVLNDTEARAIHLAFALFLAFVSWPALKSSPRDRVPEAVGVVGSDRSPGHRACLHRAARRVGRPGEQEFGVHTRGRDPVRDERRGRLVEEAIRGERRLTVGGDPILQAATGRPGRRWRPGGPLRPPRWRTG